MKRKKKLYFLITGFTMELEYDRTKDQYDGFTQHIKKKQPPRSFLQRSYSEKFHE